MKFKPFDNKVWLSSPTMHGEELEYVKEAYETNWMSTVGVNINDLPVKRLEVNMQLLYQRGLLHFI